MVRPSPLNTTKVNGPHLACSIECAMQKIPARPDRLRPWHYAIPEGQIGRGLKAPQSALFDQFIAKLREPIAGLVVAEMRSGEHAKQYVGDTRTVAVAVLEAKSNRATDVQGKQVCDP